MEKTIDWYFICVGIIDAMVISASIFFLFKEEGRQKKWK